MKTNFFYATITKELSHLCCAAEMLTSEAVRKESISCQSLHKTLCLRLFRDFITPMSRNDLYAVSSAILAVFSPLASCVGSSEGERERIFRAASLFLPLRWDESILAVEEELLHIFPEEIQGRRSPFCASAFIHLSRVMIGASLNNV